MIEPNTDKVSQEIIDSLETVKIDTLFSFNNYVVELHQTVLDEIKKRVYLLIYPLRETEH